MSAAIVSVHESDCARGGAELRGELCESARARCAHLEQSNGNTCAHVGVIPVRRRGGAVTRYVVAWEREEAAPRLITSSLDGFLSASVTYALLMMRASSIANSKDPRAWKSHRILNIKYMSFKIVMKVAHSSCRDAGHTNS